MNGTARIVEQGVLVDPPAGPFPWYNPLGNYDEAVGFAARVAAEFDYRLVDATGRLCNGECALLVQSVRETIAQS